ncbi:Flagellar hook protein FlgE [Pseudodesulfovibrio profundus]|uniref:Flagellar hook protein FlgE n=1 Tax=Pseudodesulfovibrio profundus TaxID=57320 RepID=A0A2C8F992_9BACT|nr:flagellar hook protein FlgE [Pseudodesulfovibrio profundus]MBC17716.1 flagellar hook-basal body protein [Desulfovibrio sp.]SOB59119.1 Flagellar hook protein FlgE [Pseudodesulfovibrio profundus]|tara:strand:+ start:26256 stop:27869 length:1614 start_codon:yes stop_codon:yes gene_type:complete
MSFSTMYVGATGVVAHGDRMQVIGNNLANVSTVGYKRADAQFTDLLSQQMATGSAGYESGAYSASQIGKGVAVGDIRSIFREGGLESSNTSTDMAITGNGFFGVRKVGDTVTGTGATHYTRAGNFRFNNEAYLVDPSGYRLQGYAIDRETGTVSSSATDVQLPYQDVMANGQTTRLVRSEPRASTSIDMITNLDALAGDLYTNADNPFFAMLDAYDGSDPTASTPFGSNLPAYSSSLNIYDEDGNQHDLTVYFDPVSSSSISNANPGYTYWEYLIAVPGSSDGSGAYGTSGAGLAGVGVLTFNGEGEVVNQSAYSLNGTDGKNLSNWGPASFNEEGIPQFTVTLGEDGSATGGTQTLSFDVGLNSDTSSWQSGASSIAGIGTDTNSLISLASMNRDISSTTSFDDGSATLFQNQDGFAWGYLQNTSISREGFLRGHFSNGQTEDFYQIAMYRFNSEWGLRRDGGNNFVSTEASGNPIEGVAEEGGRGTIQGSTLEMSNVDMAEEFAKMIVTQRGYQANTKVITTSDSILNTTITIKR